MSTTVTWLGSSYEFCLKTLLYQTFHSGILRCWATCLRPIYKKAGCVAPCSIKGPTGPSSQVHCEEGVSGCNTSKIYTSLPPPPLPSSPSHGKDVRWPPPDVSDCSRSRILTEISLLLCLCLSLFSSSYFMLTFMLTATRTVQAPEEQNAYVYTHKLEPVYAHFLNLI
jgi:hypothetical protein